MSALPRLEKVTFTREITGLLLHHIPRVRQLFSSNGKWPGIIPTFPHIGISHQRKNTNQSRGVGSLKPVDFAPLSPIGVYLEKLLGKNESNGIL